MECNCLHTFACRRVTFILRNTTASAHQCPTCAAVQRERDFISEQIAVFSNSAFSLFAPWHPPNAPLLLERARMSTGIFFSLCSILAWRLLLHVAFHVLRPKKQKTRCPRQRIQHPTSTRTCRHAFQQSFVPTKHTRPFSLPFRQQTRRRNILLAQVKPCATTFALSGVQATWMVLCDGTEVLSLHVRDWSTQRRDLFSACYPFPPPVPCGHLKRHHKRVQCSARRKCPRVRELPECSHSSACLCSSPGFFSAFLVPIPHPVCAKTNTRFLTSFYGVRKLQHFLIPDAFEAGKLHPNG